MKKLSEIGTEVWPYPNLGGEPKCYMLKEPAGDGHTMQILLTQDERRELVRWSILEWEASLERIGYGNAFNELSTECIDTLLKEQGL